MGLFQVLWLSLYFVLEYIFDGIPNLTLASMELLQIRWLSPYFVLEYTFNGILIYYWNWWDFSSFTG